MDTTRNLIKLSHMYYVQKMTQQQIADEMGISRIMVSRMLKRAEEQGIVEININYQGGFIELEEQLSYKYNIDEFVIVPAEPSGDAKKAVAAGAAAYLGQRLKKARIIGVGWGTTLQQIADMFSTRLDSMTSIVPMVGGHGKAALNIHASQIAVKMGRKANCKGYSILSPAIVPEESKRELYMEDPLVSEVLNMARNADVAIMGIGSPFGSGTSLFSSGYFTEDDISTLRREGVECDLISCCYLNREGNQCGINISKRCVGITKDELKKIPTKIAIAGGMAKRLAIDLALKAGFIDVMITDSEVAQYLLHEEPAAAK